MRKLALAAGTLALAAGTLALGAGAALFGAGSAAAAPGEIGPFSSDWTCDQKAYEMMGSDAPTCVYRTDDSRGKGYYFAYRP